MTSAMDRAQASAPGTPPAADATGATDDYRAVLHRSFETLYDSGRDSWTGEPAMRHLVELLGTRIEPGSHVLDIGAGRLRDTEVLLTAGHRVTAVDLVRLPEWERAAARWGERVRFAAGDVRELAEGGALDVFDAVLDNGVLHHQLPEDHPGYLAALHGRLRPGGLLAVSLFARAETDTEGVLHTAGDGRLSREFTTAEAEAMLADAGFAVIAQRRVPRERPEWTYLLVLARRGEG
ncbi:class I SAM-dependent methyltransferase [Streptomyces sp. NPDC049577]|uniref:class I SAM-dependent methyltransferase n=1 Tax=Streptomyces sp. NPDC049577 TaxID=3155153 RepID=UPI00341AF927